MSPYRQLRLDLDRPTSCAPETFIESRVNAEALAAVRNWRSWPGGALALVGPPGSGKSHLARIWARESGAVTVDIDQPISAFEASAVLVEDVDRRAIRGEPLFHMFNAADLGSRLLLTARTVPSSWPVGVPDLRSRVNALGVAELHEPDDELLNGVLTRFFRDRNIRVDSEVLTYLLRRIERSIPTAYTVVEAIDEAAASGRREITRGLAREVLDHLLIGPDLFDEPCDPTLGPPKDDALKERREPSHDR